MSNISEMEQNAVTLWAFYEAMQANPELVRFNLDANRSLVVTFLKSQARLVNPKTVGEALTFALNNQNRLENGYELAVKPDERLQAEQAAQAAAEQKKKEDAVKLQAIGDENERHSLMQEAAAFLYTDPEQQQRVIRNKFQYWNLEDLRKEVAMRRLQRDSRHQTAKEFAAQHFPKAVTTSQYPELPAKWTRTEIRRASAATLRKLLQQFGK
jgi:hypothetical protein